ncbi:hypothetical protein Pfo_002896 [Paulownia fortunei]|nr:hypothetical protein Pfo_002896 [Paulownia fortunei]
MEKLCIILLLCSIVLIATPVAHGHGSNSFGKGPNAMKNWFRKLPHMKQKVTELHFYLHDIVAGPNPTNIPISMSNFTAQSPTYFGLIAAMDDPLTAGPSPDSTIVGRAQGLFGSASLDEIGFHMTFNIVLTSGKYNGSTLSVIGHNPFMNEFRELPIVGGSGVFRLARGTALANTVVFNSTSGNAVVEYNVIVLHY